MSLKNESKLENEDSNSKNEVNINEKRIAIGNQFRCWAEHTTFHGVPIIFRAPHLGLRIFWLAVFLTSSTLCCLMLATTFTQYFSYEVITKIRSVPKRSLPIGAFTFCNPNYFVTKEGQKLIENRLQDKFNVSILTYKDVIKYSKELNVSIEDEIYALQSEIFSKRLKNSSFGANYAYSIDEFFYKYFV